MNLAITIHDVTFTNLNTVGSQSLQNIVVALERSGMSDETVRYTLTEIANLIKNGFGTLPLPELPSAIPSLPSGDSVTVNEIVRNCDSFTSSYRILDLLKQTAGRGIVKLLEEANFNTQHFIPFYSKETNHVEYCIVDVHAGDPAINKCDSFLIVVSIANTVNTTLLFKICDEWLLTPDGTKVLPSALFTDLFKTKHVTQCDFNNFFVDNGKTLGVTEVSWNTYLAPDNGVRNTVTSTEPATAPVSLSAFNVLLGKLPAANMSIRDIIAGCNIVHTTENIISTLCSVGSDRLNSVFNNVKAMVQEQQKKFMEFYFDDHNHIKCVLVVDNTAEVRHVYLVVLSNSTHSKHTNCIFRVVESNLIRHNGEVLPNDLLMSSVIGPNTYPITPDPLNMFKPTSEYYESEKSKVVVPPLVEPNESDPLAPMSYINVTSETTLSQLARDEDNTVVLDMKAVKQQQLEASIITQETLHQKHLDVLSEGNNTDNAS